MNPETVALHTRLVAQGFSLRVEADKLIVSPASKLSEQDCSEIRSHRDELVTMVDSIPSACFARTTCAVVGICGRISCLVGHEREGFADAVKTARSLENPHRVPDEFVDDISEGAAA